MGWISSRYDPFGIHSLSQFIFCASFNPKCINLSLTLDDSSAFPSCDFWNTNDSFWDTAGCFVYDITNDSVICGCTHLTTFSVSRTDILPEANNLIGIGWRILSISNLIRYPLVWMTCLVCFLIFLFICFLNPRSDIHARSILAMKDSVFKSVREEKLWKDVLGKETEIFDKAAVERVLCTNTIQGIIERRNGAI